MEHTMNETEKKTPWLYLALGGLQIIIGASGLIGGFALIADPSGSTLKLPQEWLQPTPFSDYLLPGIVLIAIIGVAHLFGGVSSLARTRNAGNIAIFLGAFLCLWIIVQVRWIGFKSLLQPLYFCLGVLELAGGILLRNIGFRAI
jgi:hypothetical protein